MRATGRECGVGGRGDAGMGDGGVKCGHTYLSASGSEVVVEA